MLQAVLIHLYPCSFFFQVYFSDVCVCELSVLQQSVIVCRYHKNQNKTTFLSYYFYKTACNFKSIQVLKTEPSLLLFLILEAPGWMTLINHSLPILASELMCYPPHN